MSSLFYVIFSHQIKGYVTKARHLKYSFPGVIKEGYIALLGYMRYALKAEKVQIKGSDVPYASDNRYISI